MKEKILKVLMENTQIEGRYIGGDSIAILSIINSEDIDDDNKEQFLSNIADEIVSALANER